VRGPRCGKRSLGEVELLARVADEFKSLLLQLGESYGSFSCRAEESSAPRLARRGALVHVLRAALLATDVHVAVHAAERQAQRADRWPLVARVQCRHTTVVEATADAGPFLLASA